jgi:hypothetical protein
LLRAAIDAPGPVDPSGDDLNAWVSMAQRERVIPQLYDVAQLCSQDLSAQQLRRVEEMQLDVASLCVRLEQSLLQVVSLLEFEGIAYAMLKGVATAHLDHTDPVRRQYGDVDLLVAPADLLKAREVLETAGWRQAYRLPPGHERFTHAVTLTSGGVTELDLHQRIAHRSLGLLVPTGELLAQRCPAEIAGRRLWALGELDRLIHAALHAVASRGSYRRLSSWADVLVLSRKLESRAPEVLERADRWSVGPLVVHAVSSAWSEALLPVPASWRAEAQSALRERGRLVEYAYLGKGRRPAAEELAHLRHLPTWSDRFLYLYGHLRMDSGRGFGMTARLRYLWSRMRDRR